MPAHVYGQKKSKILKILTFKSVGVTVLGGLWALEWPLQQITSKCLILTF